MDRRFNPMKDFRPTFAWLLLGIALLGTNAVAQEDELLPPEQAFALEAWLDGDRLVAEYAIAPGYYMYRQRFEFLIDPDSDDVDIEAVHIPPGKRSFDEFFGEIETYRDRVRIEIPLTYSGLAPPPFRLRATSQGCADIGVCYPPLKQALAVDPEVGGRFLPTAWTGEDSETASGDADVELLKSLLGEVTANLDQRQAESTANDVGTNEASDALSVLQSLGDEMGLGGDDEILHPDEAFILSARLDANNVIRSNILLADNIYLYRDKVRIALIDGDGHRIGPISLPRGKLKNDEFFGPMEVIYGELDVAIPILSEADASDSFRLSYQYQGCVEDRICYPPITKYIDVDAPAGLVQVKHELDRPEPANPWSGAATSPALAVETPISEQEQFARLLRDQSLLIIIGLFFLAGIGLTFTPCVFPMIPILSSIIAGQGESITTGKAFLLSSVYVLTMAATYASAGAIVGYYGAEFNIQIWFQDPVILSIFAAIFALLALSMFGFYDLQMPPALQSRLAAISNSQQGGTLIGVGLMGFFSAIIVGPCITAPLVGALLFISQTQDWQLGGLALFALGLGMGVPLMIVGTSAGKILPRAGAWMDQVKAFFGIVLLGVAIWLLERILPVGITMALIAALLIATAIYMGALDSLDAAASGWRRFAKAAGLLVLIYGAAYLIGAAAGSKDLIQPLRGVVAAAGGERGGQAHIAFRQIKGLDGLQLALNDSVQQGRTTMLDFYADWCISCKEMERYAFTHPDVLAALEQTATLQADVTDNDRVDTRLMSSLGIYGPPAILFFDPNGKEIRHRRVVGEMSGEKFAAHIVATFR